MNRDMLLAAAVLASVTLLGVVVFVASRGGLAGAGKTLGSAAVGAADGVVGGAVEGLGEIVGVPKTEMTECQRALAEGRTWDASFACPAKDFLKSIFF